MARDPFNRLYEKMLPFHEHFRRTHAQLQAVLPVSQRLSRRDLENFLATGSQLCHHLEMHHHIEETYIFPLLAKKMPAFAHDDAHRKEHQVMHSRIETYDQYLRQVSTSLRKKSTQQGEDGNWSKDVYDAEKMKMLIDELGQALFPHLRAEEESLKAKSMREAGWTEAEVNNIMI